jgi:pimeloyl-ACP methyl ester carboxylesterase
MTRVSCMKRRPVAGAMIAIVVVSLALLAMSVGDVSAHSCAKAGDLRFRAADGTKLAGHRFGRGETAVVFAHELRGGACQWIPYARQLSTRGYLTIAFDFRGYGDSQRPAGNAASRIAADVTAAARVARSLGARRVILVGASMGGIAVVVAAANARPAVDGVVSLSGVSTWGYMNRVAAAKKLAMPVLYVVGKQDIGFVEESQALYEATASPTKTLEIVDSAFHGVQLVKVQAIQTLVEKFLAAR